MKQIIIKSSCRYTMSIYALYIKKLLTNLNIETTFFFLPTKERKLILLRSPHVNKKSKEHFKIQYFRLVLNVNLMTESADKVFVYIISNKPKALDITLKKK